MLEYKYQCECANKDFRCKFKSVVYDANYKLSGTDPADVSENDLILKLAEIHAEVVNTANILLDRKHGITRVKSDCPMLVLSFSRPIPEMVRVLEEFRDNKIKYSSAWSEFNKLIQDISLYSMHDRNNQCMGLKETCKCEYPDKC